LNNEEGYLKGASTLLIDSTNAFLQKNLSRTPKLRLQSVAEMRVKIEELKRLRQRIELENSPKRPNVHFVCRDKEISYIDEYLQRDSYVILEGIGGIGKTELAKKYAWENRGKYDIVQFITYSGDLQTTVAYSMNFRNFDNAKIAQYESKYGNEAVEHIFCDKMSSLKQDYHGKRTLIVVDNYNTVADDHFAKFISGEYKVIFTSREKHNGSVIEITEMKSEDDLLMLFREYYSPYKLTGEQEPAVREIIRLVLGHTMTLMLIATVMLKSDKTSEEMLARFKKGLDPKLRTKIAVDKEEISAEDRENVVYGHIRSLFNMEDIAANENYAFIMTNMAIVPYTGLEKKIFYDWALSERYRSDEYDDEDYTDIDCLVDRRWIQEEIRENVRYVSLHPVISDVACRELMPDSVKCIDLVGNLIKECARLCLDKTYVEYIEGTKMLETAYGRISDETKLTANLLDFYADICFKLAKYNLALDGYTKSLSIRTKIYGELHEDIADLYNSVGLVYLEMDEYNNALRSFDKSLEICQFGFGETHHYVADVYNNIGSTYDQMGEYDSALKYFRKSLELKKDLYGANSVDVAKSLNNIATIYIQMDEQTNALEYFMKSSDIFVGILGENHRSVALLYNNIGTLINQLGNSEKALDYFLKALEIKENEYGKEHPDTSITYNSIGVLYTDIGEYDKALKYCETALDIRVKSYGKESSPVAISCSCIGTIYYRQKNYLKALDYYDKTLSIRLAIYNECHPEIGRAHYNLGVIYYELDEYSKAWQHYIEALRIYKISYPENHIKVKNIQKAISELKHIT
jgi:tetratricopeptide (TPR) repeat protein